MNNTQVIEKVRFKDIIQSFSKFFKTEKQEDEDLDRKIEEIKKQEDVGYIASLVSDINSTNSESKKDKKSTIPKISKYNQKEVNQHIEDNHEQVESLEK